jgi:tRNA-Thr(GGU) m(6)t(6)A37 methyltransferase TsaA
VGSDGGARIGDFAFHPIGVVRSPFARRGEAPRQGALAPEIVSRIEVAPAYAEALRDVESFSHLIVLFAFDRERPWSTLVQTPWSPRKRGLFATRSPDRPNPIGFTVVKLIRREKATLHVAGLDALDRTPVLDLKPYVPRFDSVPSASGGWLAERASVRDAVGKGELRDGAGNRNPHP